MTIYNVHTIIKREINGKEVRTKLHLLGLGDIDILPSRYFNKKISRYFDNYDDYMGAIPFRFHALRGHAAVCCYGTVVQ